MKPNDLSSGGTGLHGSWQLMPLCRRARGRENVHERSATAYLEKPGWTVDKPCQWHQWMLHDRGEGSPSQHSWF